MEHLSRDGECVVIGCDRLMHARRLCSKHYEHMRKGAILETTEPVGMIKKQQLCSIATCDRPISGSGFCAPHYQRFKRLGDPFAEQPLEKKTPRGEIRTCSFDNCDRRVESLDLCSSHYMQIRRGEQLHPLQLRPKRERGTGHLNEDGYIQLQIQGRKVLEHRLVMERVIGRELFPDENVHHKNGVRHDNRTDNLELWTTPQPSGQRVSDLIAFAHEILDRYEGTGADPQTQDR